MPTRGAQFRRRLAKLEESLDKRSPCAATPLYMRVLLEAQQELSPEELPLLKSAEAARREGRFHSLGEYAVTKRFQELRDIVARRYGFAYYGGVFRQHIQSQPKSKTSGKQFGEVVEILKWGRKNCAHVQALREAQEAFPANSPASTIARDPYYGIASSAGPSRGSGRANPGDGGFARERDAILLNPGIRNA